LKQERVLAGEQSAVLAGEQVGSGGTGWFREGDGLHFFLPQLAFILTF
jgi:hypothetical protein